MKGRTSSSTTSRRATSRSSPAATATSPRCISQITCSRTFVLFGRSGLGKTSLLNAGIFPRLRERRLLPVYVRTLTAPLPDLVAALAGAGRAGRRDTRRRRRRRRRRRAGGRQSNWPPRSPVPARWSSSSTSSRSSSSGSGAGATTTRAPNTSRPSPGWRTTSTSTSAWSSASARTTSPSLTPSAANSPDCSTTGIGSGASSAYGAREAIVRPLRHAGIAFPQALITRLVNMLANVGFDPAHASDRLHRGLPAGPQPRRRPPPDRRRPDEGRGVRRDLPPLPRRRHLEVPAGKPPAGPYRPRRPHHAGGHQAGDDRAVAVRGPVPRHRGGDRRSPPRPRRAPPDPPRRPRRPGLVRADPRAARAVRPRMAQPRHGLPQLPDRPRSGDQLEPGRPLASTPRHPTQPRAGRGGNRALPRAAPARLRPDRVPAPQRPSAVARRTSLTGPVGTRRPADRTTPLTTP